MHASCSPYAYHVAVVCYNVAIARSACWSLYHEQQAPRRSTQGPAVPMRESQPWLLAAMHHSLGCLLQVGPNRLQLLHWQRKGPAGAAVATVRGHILAFAVWHRTSISLFHPRAHRIMSVPLWGSPK